MQPLNTWSLEQAEYPSDKKAYSKTTKQLLQSAQAITNIGIYETSEKFYIYRT